MDSVLKIDNWIGDWILLDCFHCSRLSEQDFIAKMGLCLSLERDALSTRLHLVRTRFAWHSWSIVSNQKIIVSLLIFFSFEVFQCLLLCLLMKFDSQQYSTCW
jgi:hypothetical protein